MQTSQTQAMAKFAVNRPNAAMVELRTLTKVDRKETINSLRVYPASLLALLRADTCSKEIKVELESTLEIAGLTMMT